MGVHLVQGEEFLDDKRHKRSPLAAGVLNELTTLNPLKATLALTRTVIVLLLAIGVGCYLWSPLAIVPLVIVIAGAQQACFVLAHDAAHYRLYRCRWLNEFVGRTAGAIVGISMCTYRVVHRLHHNHLYSAQDPDIALFGGYPRGRRYLLRKLARDLAGLTAPKTYRYFFGSPSVNDKTHKTNRALDDTSPSLRKTARLDRWMVASVQLLMLAIAVVSGVWIEYVVLWVLPAVTVLQALLRFRAICEHGTVADPDSPLSAARTNFAPGWLRWWLFPHHVNYHLEHHLYPAIPHYNLPHCHAELRNLGALRGAEVKPISATVRRVFADPVPTLTD